MSLAFVGRVYSSLKGFYNEINSATLTGAIDVVIVKQPDGSYHSSPFHVRFGKLGVLRSREKIVDIEINGQAVGLHMKLGEAGEAFFVQEFTDDAEEAEFPADLATSPIESADELMAQGLVHLKEKSQRQQFQVILQETADLEGHSVDDSQTLFGHTTDPQPQSQAGQKAEDSIVVTVDRSDLVKDMKSDSSYEDQRKQGKPRQKKLTKRKQKVRSGGMRTSPRSQSMPEGLAGMEPDPIFDMDVTESTSEEEEMASYSLGTSRSMSLDMKKTPSATGVGVEEAELLRKDRRINSLETFLTPFSDPEISPPQSPLPTRPPSPKSDTEVDRQHTEENQQKMLAKETTTWDWGQFPTQSPLASPDQQGSKDTIDSALERQDSERVTSGGILSLLRGGQKSQQEQQKVGGKGLVGTSKGSGVEEKGMYLDDLTSLEDPEIAKLYLGSPRFQSIREREREDDSESGRGASLPQSPHSVDGAIGGTVSFLESEVRHLGPVALSLCGGLADTEGITLDKFMKKVMTFEDLAEQPSILSNPDLVIKIRDGYYNWATAAPLVLCEMVFSKPLPEATVNSLVKKHMPKKLLKKKTSSWWSWRSSTNQNAEGGVEDTANPTSTTPLSVAIPVTGSSVTSDNEGVSSKVSEASLSPVVSPATSPPTSAHGTPRKFKQLRRSSGEGQGTETDTDNSEKESTVTVSVSLPPLSSTPSLSIPAASVSVVIPTPSPSLLMPSSASPPTIAETLFSSSSSSSSTPKQQISLSPPSVEQTGHTMTAPITIAPSPQGKSTPISISPQTTPSTSHDTPPSISSQAKEEEEREASRQERERSRLVEKVKITLQQGREKYFKTLRLTSEQVSKLNLREGQNEVCYSVTTQYQGTTRCISHIYLWNHDDKIVISDIDGTITKSDVMGQILPLIGRDWSQSGVAQLFDRLNRNGYKLLYLSARAIGQARITKELLKSIKQGDRVLPDGPLLLNPTSLISAFHREVIVKNPEEFKIQCLKDIASLFPSSPFYAGFGNKVNDVIAYRALQIPSFRIFTINPQGHLRHEFSHTFLSSYTKMSDVADHFFPPIDHKNRSMSNEFSNVIYWRHPPPIIHHFDLDLVTSSVDKVTTVSTSSTTTTTTTTTVTTGVVTAVTVTSTATVSITPPATVINVEEEGLKTLR